MATPSMRRVFLAEASMRAYQMIGLDSPEEKRYYEATYGDLAYEGPRCSTAG